MLRILKNINLSIYRFLFAIILLSICWSCDSVNNPGKLKPSTNLEIGEEIEVANTSINTAGGTITVKYPGNEIDGMEIVIPSNSYPTSKVYKISTSEITNHKLGTHFNPITPLIQIDNGVMGLNRLTVRYRPTRKSSQPSHSIVRGNTITVTDGTTPK
jgi:hypothetical protein